MPFEELLSRIALAFSIGLLIGLERGWRTREVRPGGRAAGIRTFAISGLLGGIVGALGQGPGDELSIGGGILLGAAFAAYAVVIAMFNREENKAANTFSATTTVAALLTFALGAYALIGDMRVAAAAAVATAGVLIVREELHEWLAKITVEEFQSGLILLTMTFVALPVMPNQAIAQLGGINPREVWIIAIVLATVSFAGYVAVRLYGESRGILIAAAAGGLVSSTAVTFSLAKRAAAQEASRQLLVAGTTLATAVSFLRVAAIVAVIKPSLIFTIGPPLLAATLIAAAFIFVAARHPAKKSSAGDLKFRNPFGLLSVLIVAATMAVLIVAGRFFQAKFGTDGAIAGAAVMGLFDVDAMTVSMSQLVPHALDLGHGTTAILTGVASNVVSKIAIAAFLGGRSFAMHYLSVMAACFIGATATTLVT